MLKIYNGEIPFSLYFCAAWLLPFQQWISEHKRCWNIIETDHITIRSGIYSLSSAKTNYDAVLKLESIHDIYIHWPTQHTASNHISTNNCDSPPPKQLSVTVPKLTCERQYSAAKHKEEEIWRHWWIVPIAGASNEIKHFGVFVVER